jgi:hypothetical protein
MLILVVSMCIYILAQQIAQSKILYAIIPAVNQSVFASPESTPSSSTLTQTKVENGASSEIRLTLTYPHDGMTIHNNEYDLYGITAPGATVTVNGRDAKVKANGTFSQEVLLESGQNVIYIVAQQEDGKYSTKKIWLNMENREDNLQIND